MNPLDTPGMPFEFEVMNPNPTSSKTKNGPVYRVSFEMPQETWQMFMDANTNGMVLVFRGTVVESGSYIEEEKPKGGPISKNAGMLCTDPLTKRYAELHGFSDFKHMIYARCGISSRAELDHSLDAKFEYEALRSDFLKWAENLDP